VEAKPGLALWCLRPAVAFRPVAEQAHCVILTSGTLSPTDSLESELGVPFPVKVEAPHIVPRRQMHVEVGAAGFRHVINVVLIRASQVKHHPVTGLAFSLYCGPFAVGNVYFLLFIFLLCSE